jgi:hypothetical protein
MTTKQKIIASIWVPIVSMYICEYLISVMFKGDFLESPFSVFRFFLLGAIFWVASLTICLIIENNWIKNEIKYDTIRKILMIEALICSIPIWFLMVKIPTQVGMLILHNLMVILSIAARWGYLKWRKIC